MQSRSGFCGCFGGGGRDKRRMPVSVVRRHTMVSTASLLDIPSSIPAEHRGPAASPQQAGLRAAAVRAPLPGPPAGSGRVRSAGRRGFHRTPARPGWGRARRLRGKVRDPARASCRTAPPVRIPVLRGRGRHASSATGSAKKRNRRSRTRIWCAGSSRPVIAREPSCRPRRRSSGSAPTRWSTRNARSKPASPSGSRPGFGADLEHLLEETLRTLDIEASPVAKPLLEAVDVLRSDATARPTGFLRPNARSPER